MSNAIKVIVIGAIIGVIIFCYKLYKNRQSISNTSQNFNWRTQPGSRGSVVGQTILIFIAILLVTYACDKEIAKRMVTNPFFLVYPVFILGFYVIFPMGNKIPIEIFRAINTVIMIILIPVIIYTTFFVARPEAPAELKNPIAAFFYFDLKEGWQEIDFVPVTGGQYKFAPYKGMKSKIGDRDGNVADLEAGGGLITTNNKWKEKWFLYAPKKVRIKIEKIE